MVADVEFKDMTDIKLTDFGISTMVDEGPVRGTVGTPMYAAPEVIADNDYGVAADMWSLGVISYIMSAEFCSTYLCFQIRRLSSLQRPRSCEVE